MRSRSAASVASIAPAPFAVFCLLAVERSDSGSGCPGAQPIGCLCCFHCPRTVCRFLSPRRGAIRFRVGVPGCAADRLPLLLPLPPHRLPFSVSSPWSGPIPGRGARWVRPPAPLFAACGVERPECPNKTQHNRQRLFQYLTGTEQAFVPAGAGGVIRRRGGGLDGSTSGRPSSCRGHRRFFPGSHTRPAASVRLYGLPGRFRRVPLVYIYR